MAQGSELQHGARDHRFARVRTNQAALSSTQSRTASTSGQVTLPGGYTVAWGNSVAASLMRSRTWGVPGRGFSVGLPPREHMGTDLPQHLRVRLEHVLREEGHVAKNVQKFVEEMEGFKGLLKHYQWAQERRAADVRRALLGGKLLADVGASPRFLATSNVRRLQGGGFQPNRDASGATQHGYRSNP